jgi:hypothetical protein
MLERAVASVKEDKAKALDTFNKGEGGFKDRDLYVFCANASEAEVTGSNPVGCANPINDLLRRRRHGRTSHGAQVCNPFGGRSRRSGLWMRGHSIASTAGGRCRARPVVALNASVPTRIARRTGKSA